MAQRSPASPARARPYKPSTRVKRPPNIPRGSWLGDFKPLSEAEKRLLQTCARGRLLLLSDARPDNAESGNSIRAAFIRFLMLGGDELTPVHKNGVLVQGAWIEGSLNLQHCQCVVGLAALACHFNSEIVAAEAAIPGLHLMQSSIEGLIADGVKIAGDLLMRGNFEAKGEVRLLGAEIGGDLDCQDSTLNNHGGKALSADRITVKGSIFLCNCQVDGEVRFPRGDIEGNIDCGGATILNTGRCALNADHIRVAGSIFLRNNFVAYGEVRILGAEVGGSLECNNGRFFNEGGHALSADRIKVRGGVLFRDRFTANGEVRLLGARVEGNVSCIGGKFFNEKGTALGADTMKVEGNVFLRDGFEARGEVRLPGVSIRGDLSCSAGSFTNEKRPALNLGRAQIRGALFLRRGLFAGTIDLSAGSAGTLADHDGVYDRATLVLDGFRYQRIVGSTTARTRVEWLLRQRSAHLKADFKPQPWEQLIKVLREMGHPAEASEIAIQKQERLRLAGKIGRRSYDPKASGWRGPVRRIWVRLANGIARGLHRFYGWIAGYGHRPSRIVLWVLGLAAFCSLGFYGGREQGLIGPSNPLIHHSAALRMCGTGGDPEAAYWTSSACPIPPEYSTFQPFLYSLDVILPLIDLHQEMEWGPVVTNSRGETLWLGRALRWLMWLEIIFGWIASLMFVAIVGRLVDKD